MVGLKGNKFSKRRSRRLRYAEISPGGIGKVHDTRDLRAQWIHSARRFGLGHARIHHILTGTSPGDIRWHVTEARIETGLTDKFAGDKQEKLVLEDGTAQREAGLLDGRVADSFDGPERGELLRVGRRRIAAEGIGRPVDGVGSRLDRKVDGRSVPPAIFRRGVLLAC